MARRPTHCEVVLELLQDGEAHSHHELYALNVVAHSRIAELRRRGFVIESWREAGRAGEPAYMYRLVSSPAETDLRRPAPRWYPTQKGGAISMASEASGGWDDRERPELARDGGHGQDVAPMESVEDAGVDPSACEQEGGDVFEEGPAGRVPGSAAVSGLSSIAPPCGMAEQLPLEAA